jgi:hypothetical protein
MQKKPRKKAAKPTPKKAVQAPKIAPSVATAANYMRAQRAAASDIGRIPDVVDPERKEACRRDLVKFMQTYQAHIFTRPFCPDLLRAVRTLQKNILEYGQSAEALPRGFGKTTIGESALEWAALYGHRKFMPVIAATKEAAAQICQNVKEELASNELLAEDFPEATYPIEKLGGHNQRAGSQTYQGKLTEIEWKSQEIQLANIPGADCAGACIVTIGRTGALRGLKRGTMRPDFVFIDDCQTRETARSKEQTDRLEKKLMGDVRGLAGHKRMISGYMACTIIEKGDLSDRMTDPAQHPDWSGHRGRLVYSWPTNQKLWDTYLELWESDNVGGDHTHRSATEFYRQHREAMDAGARVADESLYDEAFELSAIQHAVNLRKGGSEYAFNAEYQNDPIANSTSAYTITAEYVAAKTNTFPRWVAPEDAIDIVAHCDINLYGLSWSVIWIDKRFSWGVLAYGRIPGRGLLVPKGTGEVEAKRLVARGLAEYLEIVSNAKIQRGHASAAISIGGIDAGYMSDVVAGMCQRDPRAIRMLVPTRGFAAQKYRPEAGKTLQLWEKAHLSQGAVTGRFVAFDADYWRSTMQRAFLTDAGAPGCGSLHALAVGTSHRDYAAQIAAEQLAEVYTSDKGGQAFRWTHEPGAVWDWADSLTGCLVMAASRGNKTTSAGFEGKAVLARPPQHRVERRKTKIKPE